MEAVLGKRGLVEELDQLEEWKQVLHVDLEGRDPDAAFSGIPYEKGALFLTRLENAFGRERFDAFLHSYFDHFAFQSITTADFVDYLKTSLFAEDETAAGMIDLNAWLEQPGLPADAPEPSAEGFARVADLAQRWWNGDVPAEDLPVEEWGTLERIRFLSELPETMPANRLAELDETFEFTEKANPEVAEHWFLKTIRSGYAPADARIEEFLTTVGRRKYLMPLYKAMAETPEGKARARAIYARARPRYHPLAISSVDGLLGAP